MKTKSIIIFLLTGALLICLFFYINNLVSIKYETQPEGMPDISITKKRVDDLLRLNSYLKFGIVILITFIIGLLYNGVFTKNNQN